MHHLSKSHSSITLAADYPWISKERPLVVAAPMMNISLGRYALATSAAGGFGFLAGGFDPVSLKANLAEADRLVRDKAYSGLTHHDGLLPIGVGIQNWGTDQDAFLDSIRVYPVAAAWFFGPSHITDIAQWTKAVRDINPATKIWVQVGSVGEALSIALSSSPDVMVIQGADAGGHGLLQRASIVSLLPEVFDQLAKAGHSIPLIAAGGIVDGRGTAAALTLGAVGVCMGTRFLASHEAILAQGYQKEVLRASDGGISTVNSTVYDRVRGIHGWPVEYGGRGLINQSYLDAIAGMPDKENEELYKQEMKKGDEGWGPGGRMTTYAGTGVGLVQEVLGIEQIVKSVQEDAAQILEQASKRWSH